MLKCLNILKIFKLLLFLLIWCQSAETLTDQLTDLGLNVSINCDLDEQEVNWLLLKLPDPPVMILLSSTTSANFYYAKTFKHKYSVQGKHHLFINNVTLDDLGLYYCVTSSPPPKYNNGTRLYIAELTLNLENKNHTVVKYINQNQTQWQIILISAGINALLIIVVIAREPETTQNNLKMHTYNSLKLWILKNHRTQAKHRTQWQTFPHHVKSFSPAK
ncbi:uncharacterized protein LOC127942625 isoform X7 [Carassius gibelio]|uniref:uncharacterized protein LOC127942625 isoform X7 n=1 Tax=Carassius gibelio TaxID=101364 RepID=UPI002279BFF3|nr:uncharacterized protein LOC127942625 isoform X7 [Carassius gibelio]